MLDTLNRRTFIKAAGLGSAGLVAAGPSAWGNAAAKPKKWRMRLSTSSIHFMGLPI